MFVIYSFLSKGSAKYQLEFYSNSSYFTSGGELIHWPKPGMYISKAPRVCFFKFDSLIYNSAKAILLVIML